jgi:hypothetical protein
VSSSLLALYRGAAREAFRLEAQQAYAVPAESAQYQAFLAGQPLPSDPAVERSMAVIREATAAGTRVHRVHVVDLPLTTYLRYEIAAYAENSAAGEHVAIAVRSWHPALAALGEDFVLFDPGTDAEAVVPMHYDAAGHLTGTSHSTDPGDVARAVRARDIAMAHAIPLHEFTALAEAG